MKKTKILFDTEIIGKKLYVGKICLGYVTGYTVTKEKDGLDNTTIRCVNDYKKWKKRFRF
jgi:hypothetical protein